MTTSEQLTPASAIKESNCRGRKKRIDRHTKNELIASAKKVATTTSGSSGLTSRGSKAKSTKRGGGGSTKRGGCGSYNWGGTSLHELEFELDFEDYPEPHRDVVRSAPQAKSSTGLDDQALGEALACFGTWTGPAPLSARSPIFVPPESVSAMCEPISVIDAGELDAVDDFNDEMARLALLEVEMAKHIARAARKKEVTKRARAKAAKRANVTKLDTAMAKARARAEGGAAAGSPTSTSTLLSMMPSDPAPAVANEGRAKTTDGNPTKVATELLLSRLRALLLVHELRTPAVVAAEQRNTAARHVAAQAAHGRRRLAQEMVAQQHRRGGAALRGDNRCWMQASRAPRRGAAA